MSQFLFLEDLIVNALQMSDVDLSSDKWPPAIIWVFKREAGTLQRVGIDAEEPKATGQQLGFVAAQSGIRDSLHRIQKMLRGSNLRLAQTECEDQLAPYPLCRFAKIGPPLMDISNSGCLVEAEQILRMKNDAWRERNPARVSRPPCINHAQVGRRLTLLHKDVSDFECHVATK